MQTALAGIIVYSPDPARLAAFYREHLGIPFADADHGTVGTHQEGMLAGVHFAIWDKHKGHAPAATGPSPHVLSFRVDDVAAWCARLTARGVRQLHKILDIGEGKRLATFVDPDDNHFRLLQL